MEEFNQNLTTNSCPMFWDGWNCWNSTPAGTSVEDTCPDMSMLGLGNVKQCVRSKVTKACRQNATWTRRTNYKKCSRIALNTRLSLVKTGIYTQLASLVVLFISLFLFIYYKPRDYITKLSHTKLRINIHLNFFISIIISSTMSVLYDYFVTLGHLEYSKNPILKTYLSIYFFIETKFDLFNSIFSLFNWL